MIKFQETNRWYYLLSNLEGRIRAPTPSTNIIRVKNFEVIGFDRLPNLFKSLLILVDSSLP